MPSDQTTRERDFISCSTLSTGIPDQALPPDEQPVSEHLAGLLHSVPIGMRAEPMARFSACAAVPAGRSCKTVEPGVELGALQASSRRL
jgi:hypothetical protein